jgi:hypothetical protein
MGYHVRATAGLWALAFLAVGLEARAAAPPTPTPGRRAAARGLVFLQEDAARWRTEKKCSTCHHGTMTVWALSEARRLGYDVTAEALADAAKWTKDRLLDRIDLPRDKRPGWSMVSTPALYLSLMAVCVPKQDAVSADELKRIGGHLLRHQEADGSWAWSSAPPKNRPPPVFESDEVATLLGYLALGPKAEGREAREKAAAWLAKAKPTDTTQAAALRLLVKARKSDIAAFLARQNKDGGWGQLKGAASDAYATGQALYVLNVIGVKPDRAEVRRAVAFLVGAQKEDGSWPITARSHPGATPAGNVVPITYFGSSWGTLGLMRSVP